MGLAYIMLHSFSTVPSPWSCHINEVTSPFSSAGATLAQLGVKIHTHSSTFLPKMQIRPETTTMNHTLDLVRKTDMN